MGIFDDYSAEFFKTCRNSPRDTRTNWIVVQEYDYARLKLFMLSMLWRAAVAKQERMFAILELEANTIEDLHYMIGQQDPGGEQDYSVMIMMREKCGGLEKCGWNPRVSTRKDGLKWVRFDLNEFSCDIKLSRHETSFDPVCLLKQEPPLLVITGPTLEKRLLEMKALSLDRQEREKDFKKKHEKHRR